MIAIKISSCSICRDVDAPTMHMWGVSEQEIITMLSFLDDLELNEPADQILPSKPKGSINTLLGKKKLPVLSGIELHKYLLQNISIDFDRVPGYVPDRIYTNIEQIKPHLVCGFQRVKNQNAAGLRACLQYGQWLELAYEHFKIKKWKNEINGTWQPWLSKHIGICSGYSKKLREVAQIVENYPKLHDVGKRFSEIYLRKKQIKNLLQSNAVVASYCQGRQPVVIVGR